MIDLPYPITFVKSLPAQNSTSGYLKYFRKKLGKILFLKTEIFSQFLQSKLAYPINRDIPLMHIDYARKITNKEISILLKES